MVKESTPPIPRTDLLAGLAVAALQFVWSFLQVLGTQFDACGNGETDVPVPGSARAHACATIGGTAGDLVLFGPAVLLLLAWLCTDSLPARGPWRALAVSIAFLVPIAFRVVAQMYA